MALLCLAVKDDNCIKWKSFCQCYYCHPEITSQEITFSSLSLLFLGCKEIGRTVFFIFDKRRMCICCKLKQI